MREVFSENAFIFRRLHWCNKTAYLLNYIFCELYSFPNETRKQKISSRRLWGIDKNIRSSLSHSQVEDGIVLSACLELYHNSSSNLGVRTIWKEKRGIRPVG